MATASFVTDERYSIGNSVAQPLYGAELFPRQSAGHVSQKQLINARYGDVTSIITTHHLRMTEREVAAMPKAERLIFNSPRMASLTASC